MLEVNLFEVALVRRTAIRAVHNLIMVAMLCYTAIAIAERGLTIEYVPTIVQREPDPFTDTDCESFPLFPEPCPI